jgi:hypothetical protein
LFEPATGRYAGSASTAADMIVTQDCFEFVDFGYQPKPRPGEPRPGLSQKGESQKSPNNMNPS